MLFGILGPLEVRTAEGELLSVGGPRPRALLTHLLLHNGRTVSVDRLVAELYRDEPPSGAANAIQAHVSRLRRSLPSVPIEFTRGGYRLTVAG
jgi:DNA-binding response OmpR family regulator